MVQVSATRLIDRHIVSVRITDDEGTHKRTIVVVGSLLDRRTRSLSSFPGRIEVIHDEPQEKAIPFMSFVGPRKGCIVMVALKARRSPVVKTQQDRPIRVDDLIEDCGSWMVVGRAQEPRGVP